jgi:hypothetical protein
VWWGGSKALDLYLGTRSARLCDGDLVLWQVQTDDAAQSLGLARGRLAENSRRRRRLRVWCSGGLCRPFMLPAVAGVDNRVELGKIAVASASAMTGLHGPCQVWLDRVTTLAGTMAVAVESGWLDEVRRGLRDCASVISIRPWWSEALRVSLRVQPAPATVGIQDCDSLVMLAGAETSFGLAIALTPLFTPQQAAQAWTRTLFGADLAGKPSWRARLRPEADVQSGLAGCALGAYVEVTM